MNWASSEVVSVLTFLLPGFVAAAVFYSLTSHPKPSEVDRVVQALIFTIVGRAVAEGLSLIVASLGGENLWTESWEVIVTVVIAVIVALVAVWITNTDALHALFRRMGLTKETSYPSEWYSTFSRNPDCYVVLHLKGERRLYGWPEEWPSRPDQGHFRIAEGEWLFDDRRSPAEGVSYTLVPATEVEMVDFLKVEPLEDSTG